MNYLKYKNIPANVSRHKQGIFARGITKAMSALGYFSKEQYKAIALAGPSNVGWNSAGKGDIKQKGVRKPGHVTFENLRRIAKFDSLIRICVNAIKKEVSQSKWQIIKKEKGIEWTEEMEKEADIAIQKFTNIFENMNANGETFRTLLDRILEDLLILDAACIEIVRDVQGDIVGLNSVDGATIRPVYNEKGEVGDIAFKQVINEKVVADFYPDEMMYLMQQPQNSIYEFGYGLSPIESVMLSVQASLQADMFNVRAFSEDNVPPGIMDLGDMSTEEAQQFTALWDATVVGSTQKMKFIWGSGGDKKYIPLTNNQKDMQYVEYLDWLSRIKLASYGLSSQDANIMQDVNRATAQVQQSVSNSRGVNTVKQLLEEHLTRDVMYSSGYETIQFKFDKPHNLDEEKTQADIDKIRIDAGIVTPDEVRERDGLPPLEEVLGEEYDGTNLPNLNLDMEEAEAEARLENMKAPKEAAPAKKKKEQEPTKKSKGQWHPPIYEAKHTVRKK